MLASASVAAARARLGVVLVVWYAARVLLLALACYAGSHGDDEEEDFCADLYGVAYDLSTDPPPALMLASDPRRAKTG